LKRKKTRGGKFGKEKRTSGAREDCETSELWLLHQKVRVRGKKKKLPKGEKN